MARMAGSNIMIISIIGSHLNMEAMVGTVQLWYMEDFPQMTVLLQDATSVRSQFLQ